jgi:DNA adenine methylase
MKPFLKWVGGKTQLLPKVLERFPRQIRNYYEPFLGGGSVLLGLLAERAAGRITVTGAIRASDKNEALIYCYKNIQVAPQAVLNALATLKTEFGAAAAEDRPTKYYELRDRFRVMTAAQRRLPAGSALFMFLNKTCFRGIWREGPNGFNVPYGNYKTFDIADPDHIHAVSALIQGVEFECANFHDVLMGVGVGDFIYADPPYLPEKETDFVGYTADGFGPGAHALLFSVLKATRACGASVLLSNSGNPALRGQFPESEWEITEVVARRAVNSADPAATAKEVLVRSKPVPNP